MTYLCTVPAEISPGLLKQALVIEQFLLSEVRHKEGKGHWSQEAIKRVLGLCWMTQYVCGYDSTPEFPLHAEVR